jgi:hypothetical protein
MSYLKRVFQIVFYQDFVKESFFSSNPQYFCPLPVGKHDGIHFSSGSAHWAEFKFLCMI